jgi:hypothetical protein
VRSVDVGDFCAGAVGERFGGAQMREEIPVALEDVEFFCGRGFVVTAVGPGASRGLGVGGGEGEGALGDSEVEVGEDELDGGEEDFKKLASEKLYVLRGMRS